MITSAAIADRVMIDRSMPDLLQALRDLVPLLRAELEAANSDESPWSYLPGDVRRLVRPTEEGGRVVLSHYPTIGHACPWLCNPWPSATLVVEGAYELSVGPTVGLVMGTGVLRAGSEYLMIDPAACYSLRPLASTWTAMLTGQPYAEQDTGPAPQRLRMDHPDAQRFAAQWALKLPRAHT